MAWIHEFVNHLKIFSTVTYDPVNSIGYQGYCFEEVSFYSFFGITVTEAYDHWIGNKTLKSLVKNRTLLDF
jgi:hypothetical protein